MSSIYLFLGIMRKIRPYLQASHYHHITLLQHRYFPPINTTKQSHQTTPLLEWNPELGWQKDREKWWMVFLAKTSMGRYQCLWMWHCDSLIFRCTYKYTRFRYVCVGTVEAPHFPKRKYAVVYHKLCIFSVGTFGWYCATTVGFAPWIFPCNSSRVFVEKPYGFL